MPEYVNPNPAKYEPDPNDPRGLICKTCKSEIQAVTQARPIWDGPFPCSGSGQCDYVQTPYCPKCETKPGFHGSPVITNPLQRGM